MKTKLANLLLIVAVLTGIVITAYSCRRSWDAAVDFPQYYAASRFFIDGRAAKIYNRDAIFALERNCFPRLKEPALFCYPPYALPLMAGLAVVPPPVFMYLWTTLGVASFFAALELLRRRFGFAVQQYLWLFASLSTSGPFCQVIMMGQPTFYMLLGLSVALLALFASRPIVAAAALVVLLPKPHFALPLLAYLCGARKFRTIVALVGLGAALLLLSIFTAGLDCYKSYFEFLKWTGANPALMKLQGCVTIRSQLLVWFPNWYQQITLGSGLLMLAGLGFNCWLGSRFRSAADWLSPALLLAIPLGFLTSLYLQPYDLFLLLPSLVCFGRLPAGARPTMPLSVLCVLSLVLFVFPIYAWIYFEAKPVNPYVLWLGAFCALNWRAVVRKPLPIADPS